MTDLTKMRSILSQYDGPALRIMEICGSHTAAIAKNGIKGMLSPSITLISGPGCPVCVTPTAYVDRAIAFAKQENTCLVTFGDLMRVPGSAETLSAAKGAGAAVEMVYAPADVIDLAKKSPERTFVFAAIGFETTTPVYALLVEELLREKVTNVKLLTALKTMPAAVSHLLDNGADLQGFLAPGHVCAVTGSEVFAPLAKKYGIPFAVAGFDGEGLLAALCGLLHMQGKGIVKNFYPAVVTAEGNQKAKILTERYFEETDASWRGLGVIPGSGLKLREEYASFDAGSNDLYEDNRQNPACRCGQVLTGKISPTDCPLFGKACSPLTPQGACMVSEEGSCHTAIRYTA